MIIMHIGDDETTEMGTYVLPDAPAKNWKAIRKQMQAAMKEYVDVCNRDGLDPYDVDKTAAFISAKIGYAMIPPKENAIVHVEIPNGWDDV
jgi:hypothetical protein